ncbi:CD276 antigen-like protein [Labeo rohita]|uniref:CD276 antigen-like protein n=1 Tax=Labeo rohita TaxID=84645 RepID=A0A498LZU6_LABRO|nr:CD276 antigen-like protein [Labeo rohita]RXN31339.1 CD276 antigen-like protein [Labeo rohita]
MGQSWWYIINISVFLLCITGSFSAPVRVTVKGFIGESAVFSCSIPESEIQDNIEKFSVHFRVNEKKIVCDIVGSNRTCKDQAAEYKDRVETFPEDQKKGNFTFKLNALQKSDARKYQCHITGPFQNHTITELLVKGVYNLSFTDKIVCQ